MARKLIKLAHIVLNLNTGGLEKLVVEFATKPPRNFLPIVFCLKEKGELAQEVENSGVKVLALSKKEGFDTLLIFRLALLFQKEKISIVHTHNFAAYLYGTLAARVAGVPIVIDTEHGVYLSPQIRHKVLTKMISPLVNKVIAVSDDVKKAVSSHDYISESRIVTITNGIDINKYSQRDNAAAKKRELGLSGETEVIGNVARLSPEKDHKTLLEAFSLVSKKVPSVKLVIAGDGILMEELEIETKELGMEDNVIFLGLRKDVPELLSTFDLFVLSSIREGIPLTILEAMAAGLPVVGTNVGGIGEVVMDGETGFVVPSRDPIALADAIVKILSDKCMAKEMGLKGKKRGIESFSIEQTIRKYEGLYRDYLIRKGLEYG